MELQRALADLAEVRDRLAHVQRFEGYSGPAAAASGVCALVAGLVQHQLAPVPQTPEGFRVYLLVWLTCLVVALAINYGAVVIWMLKSRGPGAQSQFQSAARTIAPSVLLGGALSIALIQHGAYDLLPGTWFALYAIGLFASRDAIPNSTLGILFAFAALALLFLITPFTTIALAWWVMPLGFGLGQIAIGYRVWQERES